ncbi:hypothetical protein EYF80_058364 [Liparis tanakae]|uniref:Uncharacterized protein n=1 Tax=Liparis tanakae TaxID=230148 RepID=A0A4Z2ERM3_9TELE|nr:hypothetical protein EYF80_058364 [Liparis tanakae]
MTEGSRASPASRRTDDSTGEHLSRKDRFPRHATSAVGLRSHTSASACA